MNPKEIAAASRAIADDLDRFATLSPTDYEEKAVVLRKIRDRLSALADEVAASAG